ncbi:hypothetical protein DP59_6020 [Burkholderia pseudomallei]|nr:hypothetical protein DP59_6020 [Burkholderia pseudomallei]
MARRDRIGEQRAQRRTLRAIVRGDAGRARIGREPPGHRAALRVRQFAVDERRQREEPRLVGFRCNAKIGIVAHR